jgi:hypothetical protein
VSLLKIKIPSKILGSQRCAEGFNSGVTGLITYHSNSMRHIVIFGLSDFLPNYLTNGKIFESSST